MNAKILIIEDDLNMARGLAYNLEQAGYVVETAGDGRAGLEKAQSNPPDLLILDLMLPGMIGMEVLARLRDGGSSVPVVILSAIDDEVEKVRGFDLGAIDYVTKPFGVAELLARIRARLKHTESTGEDRIELPHGVINLERFTFENHAAAISTAATSLTPTEVDILRELRRSTPKAVSRHDMIRALWGLGGLSTRTLDTHVARLRKKIEADPARPRHLVTVHGVGYRLLL